MTNFYPQKKNITSCNDLKYLQKSANLKQALIINKKSIS